MKIVALNGSPTKRMSGTEKILDLFLEGAKEEGAEVKKYNVAQMDINPCKGCMACWFQTPGECVQKDELTPIIDEIVGSDVLVLATPLYVDGMTAQLKGTLDRFLQTLEPWFELRDGHCRHPRRNNVENGKMVLVSVSGFHELDNFDPLVAHVEAIAKNMDREVDGTILRPYAKIFPFLKMRGVKIDHIYEHVMEAGRQLVKDGRVSTDTEKAIQEQVVTQQELVNNINATFKQFKRVGNVAGLGRSVVQRIRG